MGTRARKESRPVEWSRAIWSLSSNWQVGSGSPRCACLQSCSSLRLFSFVTIKIRERLRRGTRRKPRRRRAKFRLSMGSPGRLGLGVTRNKSCASVFAHGRSSPARHLSAERRSFGAWRDHVAGKGNAGSPVRSRVEIWRGGGRFSLNCCRPFRLSVSEYLTMSRFSRSRSSNWTGRFPASSFRTRGAALSHTVKPSFIFA
jgi:hypothetical protein